MGRTRPLDCGTTPRLSTLWRVRDGRYKDSNSYVYRFSGSANGRKGKSGGGQVFREFSHVSGNFCSGSREWQSIIFVPDPASYGTTLISCPALPCDNEHMQDTVGILEQLRGMRHDLEEQYHVKRIGIFGSYAKKAQTDESDLDLVVEFSRPIGMLAFVHLKDLLSRRLNLRIDLVTPDGLHPLIRDQVMHEVVYA